jgi:hypothetical protein
MSINQTHTISPPSHHHFTAIRLVPADESLVLLLLIEHALLLLKFAVMAIIDDVPPSVLAKQAARKRLSSRRSHHSLSHHKQATPDIGSSDLKATGNVTAQSGASGAFDQQVDQATARAKMRNEFNQYFGYQPTSLMTLLSLPMVLFAGMDTLSPLLYVPAACAYFGYWQRKKDFAEKKAALGIIADPHFTTLTEHCKPSWMLNSDERFESVEWLNFALKVVFPYISFATERITQKMVQPILDEFSTINRFELTEFEVGQISPQIDGIWAQSGADGAVQVYLKLSWYGEPVIQLKYSIAAAPEGSCDLAHLKCSAFLCITLHDTASSVFVGPRAMTVTFLEAPTVDFTLTAIGDQMGSMIKDIVVGIIDDFVESKLLFPSVLAIAIDENMSKEELRGYKRVLKGVLHLTIESGSNLQVRNTSLSDNRSNPQHPHTLTHPIRSHLHTSYTLLAHTLKPYLNLPSKSRTPTAHWHARTLSHTLFAHTLTTSNPHNLKPSQPT